MNVAAAKIGVGFSLVLGILGLVQTRAFSNGLLGFVAAGIIPGTNIKLSPDIMMAVSAATLLAMLIVLFRQVILPGLVTFPHFRRIIRYKGIMLVSSELRAFGIICQRYAQHSKGMIKPWAQKALSYLSSR